jgi:short-subunit dehydrogenase
MKCVLITGATAGIGKEIAYSYASRGYNLFLVARREKRLIEISKQISDKFNINVNYLVSDLKDKNSPKEIYDFANANLLDIDTLVSL